MGCAGSSDLGGEVNDPHHRYSSLELHDLIYPDQSKSAVAANEKAIFGTDGVILVDPSAPPAKSAGPLASDSREIRSGFEAKSDNIKVAVHARIRPLQSFEKDAGARAVNVPFAVASAAGKDPNQAGSDSANIEGFASTLGPEVENKAVFEATFAKQVDVALKGGHATLCCYGCTGGGKTHTVIGYDDEDGMHEIAVKKLLAALPRLEDQLSMAEFAALIAAENDDDLPSDAAIVSSELKLQEAIRQREEDDKARIKAEIAAMEQSDPEETNNAATRLQAIHRGRSTRSVPRVRPPPPPPPPAPLPELCCFVTAYEVYGDKVNDLLGMKKTECSLRVDGRGLLKIGPKKAAQDLSDVRPELSKSGSLSVSPGAALGHSLAIAVTSGLGGIMVKEESDLELMKASILKARCTGLSDTLDQSARSHCVLQVEITTQQVIDSGDALEKKKAEIPALNNARDNLKARMWFELVDQNSADTEPVNATTKWKLTRFKDERGSEGWKRHKALCLAQLKQVEDALAETIKEVALLQKQHDQLIFDMGPAVGGTLKFVDLAGADNEGRDSVGAVNREEQIELADVNKSMLALKDCLRAIAGVPGAPKKPPFRNSNLTRLLQDSLAPDSTTSRKNPTSHTVLITCVSPADVTEKKTVASLRAGQIFGKAPKKGVGKATRAVGTPKAKRKSA